MAIVVGTNSYVTIAEIDAYCAERYGMASWALLTETVKTQLLISAVQQLDLQCRWNGFLSDTEQVLAFPRYPGADPVPEQIKDAQCEIAYAISVAESTTTEGGDPLTELKAGPVTFKFDAKSTSNPLTNDLVTKLLAQFGICGGSGGTRIVLMERC